eukprot:gene10675-7419_t
MSFVGALKELKKRVKGSNITVEKAANDGVEDESLVLLHSIANDDQAEVQWYQKNLRPARNLVHPSEAFIQGIKALRPAAVFNTFDIKKAKLRRLTKQQKDKRKAMDRRKKEIAPTAAFKASINPHKTPRVGGHATAEEARFLSRGKKRIDSKEGKKEFFKKWKKEKAKKIVGGSDSSMRWLYKTAHAKALFSFFFIWASHVLLFFRLIGQLPRDLKDVSGALGCLYGMLPDADEYGQFVLPQEAVASYHQLGYVKLPRLVLEPKQIDMLADEVNQLANNVEHHPKSENLYATSLADLTGGPIFCCQGQWRASWGMHDLIYLPSLTVAASQVLQNSLVRLWYDEVYMKEPRVGPCIPWQQNFARWQHTKPLNHVSIFIALDTLNKDRGAPCLIPGSHRWRDGNLLPPVPYDPGKDESQQLNSIWDIVDEEEREVLLDSPPETIDLRRGKLFLFILSPFTPPIPTGPLTFTVGEGPLLPNTTRFHADAMIQGPYFPTVFDPGMTENIFPMLQTHNTHSRSCTAERDGVNKVISHDYRLKTRNIDKIECRFLLLLFYYIYILHLFLSSFFFYFDFVGPFSGPFVSLCFQYISPLTHKRKMK